MAITGIIRPGHVQLRVLDIEAAVRHYRDVIGLIETARDPQGRIYLKAWDEHDHHSVVLREADTAGMDFMGFRVDSPATLAKLAADVKASGLATDMQWIEAGEHLRTGQRLRRRCVRHRARDRSLLLRRAGRGDERDRDRHQDP